MANPVLQPIVQAWMQIIHRAHEHKIEQFQNDADEAMRFFDGPYDWLYTGKYGSSQSSVHGDGMPKTTFRMTHNRAAELVQLYGPSLYSRNPHRQFTLRKQSDYPFDLVDPQQQEALAQRLQQKKRVKEVGAGLMEELLNYTPNELDLRLHSRRAVDEAILKGMGVVWIEPYKPPASPYTFVGSFHDTVNNLLLDPDRDTIQHATWAARRHVRPKWQVAKEFDIPLSDFEGGVESASMQSVIASGGAEYDYFRQTGQTNDLIVYFEVFSRMGLGHRMHDKFNKHLGAVTEILDEFGDNVRIVVSDSYPYPLNLPEKVFEKANKEEIRERLQWPTPFWLDPTDPWPFAYLAFHERSNKLWPMSHLKPGLGQLKFLNWSLSFLADKVKNTSRDFIATLRSIDEDMKANILGGSDLTLLEFEKVQGTQISELIQFLQHPPMNKDILQVTAMLDEGFEKAVGLDELMYGTSRRSMRSAAEANVKGEAMRIRPDDMAECVEAWSTMMARKEAIASYWHYKPEDVLPILGEERTQLYTQTVMQMDVREVIYEFSVRIEAGSIRKPNKARDLENINKAVQVWGPVVQAYSQMTGDFEPLNFLAQQWQKANDMEEQGIQFKPPPPPEPDQSEQQQKQMELQMKQQEHQMALGHKQEDHQLKMQQDMMSAQMKSQIDASKHGQDQQQDEQEHVQELTQDQQQHVLDLDQDQRVHLQELLQARAEGSLDLFFKEQLGAQQVKQAAKSSGNGSDNA